MSVQVGIKEINVNAETMIAQVDAADKDKMILVIDGRVQEVDLPYYGDVIIKIQDGKIMCADHHIKTKMR
ncbi:hypothetical protein [Robertmurraya sp.]|uniref:hypothetical protein n=1 Tax=Robertmurraya sp. TaxID=2837525 RepID=UPI00370385EA